MTTSIGFSDHDSYSLQSNATWDILYHFIRNLVRTWVRSSRIPLWHGQEEEIEADIVQETMLGTFKYASKFSLWIKGGEAISHNSLNALKSICENIAKTQYKYISLQDTRLIQTRSCKYPYQGYVIIYELPNSLEAAIDDTFQEWCCDHLASEVTEIPPGPRTGLLVYLANHARFDAQISHLLQKAFLKQNIQLQDYQLIHPNNPIIRSKRQHLLQIVHKRIMRKQEKINRLANGEVAYPDQKPEPVSHNQPPDTLIENAELIVLAAELDATAPRSLINPVFRQTLQNKLLDIQTEYSVPGVHINPDFRKALRNKLVEQLPAQKIVDTTSFVLHDPLETNGDKGDEKANNDLTPVSIPEDPDDEKANNDLTHVSAPEDPDADNTDPDLGLTILLACLDMDVAFTDPAFQSALKDKIADNPLLVYSTLK